MPRIGRLLDIAGLVLLLAGAAVAGNAWLGLRAMPEGRARRGAEPGAVAAADKLWLTARIGVAIMLAGAVTAVAAAVVARVAVQRGPE